MYPLHDFDYKHINQSILKSDEITSEYKKLLKIILDGERDFITKDIYFLIAVIQNNHGLSENYKELLINMIMGNEVVQ